MTPQEYLLTCLMEECAEVQHACSKALRFGLQDQGPKEERPNAENIIMEFMDAMAIVEMLQCDNYIPKPEPKDERMIIMQKIGKVTGYMEYSRKVKCLEPIDKQKVLDVVNQSRGCYMHLKTNKKENNEEHF